MTARYVLVRQAAALAMVIGLIALMLGFDGKKKASTAYTLLSHLRTGKPAPQRLLLIDSADCCSPQSITNMYLVLTEMQATAALLEIEVQLESTDESLKKTAQYFTDEFSIIQNNIQTLFDGIRFGSIQPQDTDRFVSKVLELSGKSKDRLLLRASGKEARGLDEMGNAQELFLQEGELLHLDSFTVPADSTIEQALLEYIKAVLIAVYPDKNIKASTLTQDTAGTVLLEAPLKNEGTSGFRQMDAHLLDQYLALEQKLYTDLKEMERLGYFKGLDPLAYPSTLYEYAQSLLQDALRYKSSSSIQDWRRAKDSFYTAAGMMVEHTHEEAVKDALKAERSRSMPEAVQEVQALRELAEQSFSWTRESFNSLKSLRDELQETLYGSVCFIGTETRDGTESLAYTAALISHTIISPGQPGSIQARQLIYISIIPALIVALLLGFIRPVKALITGTGAALLYALLLSLLFIKAGFWIDPEAGTAALLAAAATSAISHRILGIRYRRSCKKRFATRISKQVLHQLYAEENPANPCGSALSAVITVRNDQPRKTNKIPDEQEFRSLLKAQNKTAEFLKNNGATILGSDGVLLFAAFNSPLWPMQDPAQKAVETLLLLCNTDAFIQDKLHAGIDVGPCVFDYQPLHGYTACGQALIYARLLSSLAASYDTALLISASVYSLLTEQKAWTRKDSLVDTLSGEERIFYAYS